MAMLACRRSILASVTLAVLCHVYGCAGDDTPGPSHPPSKSQADAGAPKKDAGVRDAAPAIHVAVDAAAVGPACPYLVNTCAPYDDGSSSQVHDCVKLGLDGQETLCSIEVQACSNACATAAQTEMRDASHIPKIPDAGHSPPTGTSQPSHDAGPPPLHGLDAGASPDAGLNVCQEIGAVCALIDPGTGPVHDCTALGTSTDLDNCNSELDHCSTLCGNSICVRLGSICHDVDPGSGPLHDCHFGGHAMVASWCFDNALHCYAICEAAAEEEGLM